MKLSTVVILAITILIGLFLAYGIFWFFDLANLRTKLSLTAVVKNMASSFVPENLSWTKIKSSAPWEPRDAGETFLFQNKMWLMGGLSGNNKANNYIVEYWTAPHFNDIWNTEDGVNWNLIASSSAWSPRRSMSVTLFQNKLWMLGGWSPITGYTNDIWTSNDGVRWTKIIEHAAFPAVEGQSLIVFQNKLWKIGGVNYDERQTKNEVWYSENGIDWIKVENIPWKPRWDHAVTEFKGRLFLAGGINLAGEVFNDVWVSEDGIHWSIIVENAPWSTRKDHALKVYKGKLWLIGRLNDVERGVVNDVWFSNDGITWQKTARDPQWTGREDFFSAVFKDKIWVFGGFDANWQWRNDVWASKFIMP